MVTKARQLAEFIANADVDSDEIATGAVSASKLAATLDLSSKTIVMPDVASFNITSGDVGIGTSSPSSLIHLSGAAASSGAVEIRLEDTAASSNSRLMRTGSAYSYAGVGANETWVYHAGAGTINIGPDGAGVVKIVNNGSERMRIDSIGRVGIGTSSPNAKLDVVAPSSAEAINIRGRSADDIGQLKFYENDGTTSLARLDARTTHFEVGAYNELRFSAGGVGNSHIVIDTSGNLGIGTSSPAYKFHQHESTSGANYHLFTNSSTGSTTGDGFRVGIDSNEDALLWLREGNNMKFATSDGERMRISGTGDLELIQSNNLYWKHAGGGTIRAGITASSDDKLTFSTGSSDTTRMTIDGSGVVEVPNSGQFKAASSNATKYVRMYAGGGTGKWDIYGNGANLRISDNMSAGVLAVDTGATFGGSVGIGTGDPSPDYGSDTALEIKGASSPGLVINDTGQASKYGIHADSNDLKITYGTGALATFQNDGNVGIGTSSPTSNYGTNLNVHSSATNGAALHLTDGTTGDTNNDGFHLISTGGLAYVWNREATDMVFATSNIERMRIDSSGNVGIGQVPVTDWSSTYDVLQVGAQGVMFAHTSGGGDASTWITNNAYVSSSGWKALSTNEASHYQQKNGEHYWSNAPSVSSGATLTFSTQMKLDTSGNLLVGVSSSSANMAGAEIGANGQLYASTSSSSGHFFNRTSGNGNVLSIRQGGTTYGAVGHFGGTTYFNGNSHGFLLNGAAIEPTALNGSRVNGQVDIGGTGYKFKDLYLSSGVYLGGTGSANKLDDYEEGTFTPNVGSSSGSGGVATGATGKYTRIGNRVFADFFFSVSTLGSMSGVFYVVGFPYTANSSNLLSQGAVRSQGIGGSNNIPVTFEMLANNSYGRFHFMSGSSSQRTVQVSDVSAGDFIAASISYIV